MANKVLDNQCPSCNAPLFFNAKLGKFKCEYCDSEFTIEDIDKHKVKIEDSEVENTDDVNYVTYNCPDCGAQIIADEHTASTFCLYCGNASILKNRLSGKFAPDSIILFATEKNEAIDAFKKLSKGRPLMPKSFNSEENIEKITGLYVPFWLYDIEISGTINAKGTKVSSWTRGDTRYTKTDYYNLVRGGETTYRKIPVDGSTRFTNDIMNTIEPFDYNKIVDYNHAYLSGYLSEKYDIDSDTAYSEARDRAVSSTKDIFMNDIKGGYSSKVITNYDLKDNNISTKYALLPVWMVNVKYKDKFYLFAMNGQTGEFVGNIPLDKKKTIIMSIVMFVSIFAIVIVGSFILYQMGVWS